MTADLINGLLEMGGALVTLLSVRQLLRDRQLRGAHWGPTIFFTAWGVYNLWFYPSLHLPLSATGAALMVGINTMYLVLMLRFWIDAPRCLRDIPRHHPNCRCECAESRGILYDRRYRVTWRPGRLETQDGC